MCLSLLLLLQVSASFAQISELTDSLKRVILNSPDDSTKVNTLNHLSEKLKQSGIYDSAFFYAESALKLSKKINFRKGIADSYNLKGIVNFNQGNLSRERGDTTQTNHDFSEALKNYSEALKIRKSMGDMKGIADTYNNIGNIYAEKGNYPEALKSYFYALKIEEETGDKTGIAGSSLNIGILELNVKNPKNARQYLETALSLAIDNRHKELITECYSYLGELHSATRNFKGAYQNFKLSSLYKDSLFSEEKSKEIGRLEMRHEYEMAEIKQRQVEEERSRQLALALSRRNRLQYSGMLFGIFVLFVSLFFIGKFRLPEWAVKMSVFVPFLILFEFLLVFLDPFLDNFTSGEPVYKLLVNAVLAGIIFPIHGFFERMLKKRVFKTREEKKVANSFLPLSLLVILSFLNSGLYNKTDSLRKQYKALTLTPHSFERDTTMVYLLNELAWEIKSHKTDSAILLSGQALALSKKIKWEIGLASSFHNLGEFYRRMGNNTLSLTYYRQALALWEKLEKTSSQKIKSNILIRKATALGNIGTAYFNQNDYSKAMEYYKSALKIAEDFKIKYQIAIWLGNIGNVYLNQANYPKALEYFFQALKIDEEINDKFRLAIWNGNIGNVYLAQNDFPKTLEYYFKALKMKEELNDKMEIATTLGNIGNVYATQGEYSKALEYYLQALKTGEEAGDKTGMTRQYSNIGVIYASYAEEARMQGDTSLSNQNLKKAYEYFFKALKMSEELKTKAITASCLGNIGTLLTETGKFPEAEKYLKHAIAISDTIGALDLVKTFELSLTQIYDTTLQYRLAYMHYQKYCRVKDSLFNEEKSKDIGKLETKYEYELAEVKRLQQEEERSRQEAVAVGRRNKLQYSGMFIGIFVMFVTVFFVGRFNLPHWTVELAVFVPFLIFFEFILVLLDPYIEGTTGGEPLFKLMVNALLAAVIFPLHVFFERLLKKRIIKNE